VIDKIYTAAAIPKVPSGCSPTFGTAFVSVVLAGLLLLLLLLLLPNTPMRASGGAGATRRTRFGSSTTR
jgi:hypothetical protein